MTDQRSYRILIETIFGKSVTNFDESTRSNNVTGAIYDKTYNKFWNAFFYRLLRLNAIYINQDSNRIELIRQINELAKDNWKGAYSELVAYDFFHQDYLLNKTWQTQPIKLNNTITAQETFASELGNTNANLDGYLDDFGVFFDVKSFKDNVKEIFQGIYYDLKRELKTEFLIQEAHNWDVSYDDFQAKRKDLLNELVNLNLLTNKPKTIISGVLPELRYSLLWEKGVTFSEGAFSSYTYSNNMHMTVFNHAKKFTKNRPFYLVFVVFPWFNGIIHDFRNSNQIFYRSFSRRVFCQYLHSKDLFSSFNSKFTGSQTIYDVSKKITGIIFLEDKLLNAQNPSDLNISAYIYHNPNADNTSSYVQDLFSGMDTISIYDDFSDDNY